MDYATAVNAEIKDLFAAGADIVQIDEPYMQARPAKAEEYGPAALEAALEDVSGATAVHICFGYAAIIHERPSGYSFLGQFETVLVQPGLAGDRAIPSRLRRARRVARQEDHARRHRPQRHDGRNAGDGRGSHPPRPSLCRGRGHHCSARLRHEISAARSRVRQNEGHGRGGGDHARRIRRARVVDGALPPRAKRSNPNYAAVKKKQSD